MNRLLSERQLAPDDAIDRARVTVNLAESPLAWLARHNMVTNRQFAAGERLRGDFMAASLSPRVTMRWDAMPVTRQARGAPSTTAIGDGQMAARARFDAALAAAGPGLSDVLWRVVCAGEGLETAEKALGWPSRAGKLVLCLALDRVAGFYRI